jgi:omega-6 fatty acid desaturase (delta-12 desaturase)
MAQNFRRDQVFDRVVDSKENKNKTIKHNLMEQVAKYRKTDLRKAVWQLVNTTVPYSALWILMIFIIKSRSPYWITLPVSLLAGMFLVRIFIFFHDCGHGSFFASSRANKIIGYFTGILTLTPFYHWRHSHNLHHATAGNLDQRGLGDVWTMTVDEYLSAPKLKQIKYRFYRNPLVLLILGPLYSFFIKQRFRGKKDRKRERMSVIITNITLLMIIITASLTIGLTTYILIQLPFMLFGGILGVWLFYVQHQFKGVYWARNESWDSLKASLEGSSYYQLPKVLQWFTGNIGLHHIHHVDPRIPNYNLQLCYKEMPIFQSVKPLTIRRSLSSLRLNLYDEDQQKMVSFRSLKHDRLP